MRKGEIPSQPDARGNKVTSVVLAAALCASVADGVYSFISQNNDSLSANGTIEEPVDSFAQDLSAEIGAVIVENSAPETETIVPSTLESTTSLPPTASSPTTTPETTVPQTTTTTSTTTSTTTTLAPAPTTTTTIPNTNDLQMNDFGMPAMPAEFRGSEIDCNGRYTYGSIENLWLLNLVQICDGANGDAPYSLDTLLERNQQLPFSTGDIDSMVAGQVLNLGKIEDMPPYLGKREPAVSSTSESNDNSTVSFNKYKDVCTDVGGSMGSSSAPTLTEYILNLGGTTAEAIGFSNEHPALADGWSRFGEGNYCLLVGDDLKIYD